METNIHAVKIGKTINIWLNGQLKKKICDTNEKADKLFKLLLDEKSNPTKDSVNKILSFLNEKTRIAMECGLENDPQTGEVYMAGFSTPVPETLIDVIKEYHEKGFPLKAVVNFWMMLMLNLDKRIRNDLFDFINQHDFVLTDNGYLIVYKAVDIRTTNIIDDDLSYFINKSYNKVKKTWTTNPKRYIVYLDLNDDTYRLTKTSTADKWDLEEKEIEILGNLNDLYLKLETKLNDDIVEFPYTDKYTGKFKIKLGEPVKMLRNECNGDPVLIVLMVYMLVQPNMLNILVLGLVT